MMQGGDMGGMGGGPGMGGGMGGAGIGGPAQNCAGYVKFFNQEKGYGFIIRTDQPTDEEIFVHFSGVSGNPLQDNDQVTFNIIFDESKQKYRAEGVQGGTGSKFQSKGYKGKPHYGGGKGGGFGGGGFGGGKGFDQGMGGGFDQGGMGGGFDQGMGGGFPNQGFPPQQQQQFQNFAPPQQFNPQINQP